MSTSLRGIWTSGSRKQNGHYQSAKNELTSYTEYTYNYFQTDEYHLNNNGVLEDDIAAELSDSVSPDKWGIAATGTSQQVRHLSLIHI